MRTRRIIDDPGADTVVAAAEQYANARGHRVVIAVVDPHGELVQLRRTPGAQIASSRVAVDKARTAAIFVRPSRVLEEQVTDGRLGARIAAEATGAVATARGVSPVAAVVDAGGEPVYLWRPDGAQVASVGVATDKARTAAIYRRPSRDFEDQASGGRPSALHLARAVPLQGGIPIVAGGHVIGAIGVSGATSADEDNELAVIGAAALSNGHRN